MKTHNKPVIFIDLGAVYFTHGSSIARVKISRKFGIPEDVLRNVLTKGSHARKYYSGKIGAGEFWKKTAKSLGLPENRMKEIEYIWFSSYTPQKGMRRFVRRLKKIYRVAVLSGNLRERVEFLDKRHDFKKDFHDHHYSFDHGVNKPDVRLFKRAIKRMHLSPKDCIVVDDMEKFIADVKKTGAKTILFKNAKQMEKELRKLGVEI